MMGEGKDMQKPIEDTLKFLEESQPQLTDITLAYTAGMLTEMSGDNKLATKTYERLAKVFSASKDPKLAEFAKVLEGVVRRLNLVGQEMKLEGKLLDGKELDLSKYAGKVVLITFWATDYPTCIRELPNLKACYDKYHAKGFDIVAFCLDRDKANVEDCVKARKIEWANVVGGDKPNPAMVYYGITNLPTTMLIGKDGKVMATNLRGEKLKETLAKLFGSDEKPEAKEDAAKVKEDVKETKGEK
jgi:thiol-disulfide isomerase/thioredoxin